MFCLKIQELCIPPQKNRINGGKGRMGGLSLLAANHALRLSGSR
jgi:hypothetical protein